MSVKEPGGFITDQKSSSISLRGRHIAHISGRLNLAHQQVFPPVHFSFGSVAIKKFLLPSHLPPPFPRRESIDLTQTVPSFKTDGCEISNVQSKFTGPSLKVNRVPKGSPTFYMKNVNIVSLLWSLGMKL